MAGFIQQVGQAEAVFGQIAKETGRVGQVTLNARRSRLDVGEPPVDAAVGPVAAAQQVDDAEGHDDEVGQQTAAVEVVSWHLSGHTHDDEHEAEDGEGEDGAQRTLRVAKRLEVVGIHGREALALTLVILVEHAEFFGGPPAHAPRPEGGHREHDGTPPDDGEKVEGEAKAEQASIDRGEAEVVVLVAQGNKQCSQQQTCSGAGQDHDRPWRPCHHFFLNDEPIVVDFVAEAVRHRRRPVCRAAQLRGAEPPVHAVGLDAKLNVHAFTGEEQRDGPWTAQHLRALTGEHRRDVDGQRSAVIHQIEAQVGGDALHEAVTCDGPLFGHTLEFEGRIGLGVQAVAVGGFRVLRVPRVLVGVVQAEGQVPAVTRKEVRPVWCVDGHGWCTLGGPCLTQRERDEVVSSTTTSGEVKRVGLVGTGSCDEFEVPHKVGRLDVRCDHTGLDQALRRAQLQFVDGRRRCADGDVGPHERAVFDAVAQPGHENVRFVLEHPGHGQVRLEHGGAADAGVHRRQGHAQFALQRQEGLQFHEFHNNIEGRVHASTQADHL